MAASTCSAGGRRRAPSISSSWSLLVLFFVVHIVMVVLAGPLNELRSMITGYYRTSPGTDPSEEDKTNG